MAREVSGRHSRLVFSTYEPLTKEIFLALPCGWWMPTALTGTVSYWASNPAANLGLKQWCIMHRDSCNSLRLLRLNA